MRIQITNVLPCKLDEQFEVIDNTLWFVAYDDDGTIMGYSGIQFNWFNIPVYFSPAYVFPAYRGQGIQRKLMDRKIEWCKENGNSELTTMAHPDNMYSRRNIEAAGFVEHSRYPGEIWYVKEI